MSARLASRWRWYDSGAADGATNMARDVALMHRAASTGEAVLRVYGWSRPTVSFGVHERARLSADDVARAGWGAVRRPTGGRALLHHHELTYSVTAPTGAAALSESYSLINGILLAALRLLGVAATAAKPTARASSPDGAACFAEPNTGELVFEGRKLVGSAQRRDGNAFLQHGSILLEDDQGVLGAPATATLNQALGRSVGLSEVAEALLAALAATVGAHAKTPDVTPLDAAEIAALEPAVAAERAHFLDPRWTWRR